jgi:hypothetical protein
MARKAKTAIEMPQEKPDFETHLANLYKFFGPKLDDSIDPPEVIVSGMARTTPDELTFDQLNLLNLHCIAYLTLLSKSKDKLDQLTFKDKVANFVDWLRGQSFEMQVLSLRQAGQTTALNGDTLKAIVDGFPEFKKQITKVMP